MAEALFWPAILGYGEAAIAYSSARYTRLATWGVRLGWIAQTALLAVQAARVDGFPWSTWAGSLNLFVWFVVGAYLIWGCQPRYRLVGLTVMPLAALLFVVSRVGGGTAAGERSHYGNLFLTVHVGCVLAAFAGFTLAAALAVLYLAEERRLQRHAPDILRLKLPSLVVLEKLTIRTIAVSLPFLTVGLAAGFVRLREQGDSIDALMAATIVTWFVYAGFLAVRATGRRAAHLALIGFALVILARIALAGSHF
ncbi:MAG TPA: cytochrome c biogenesis protein CcsA [Gaiellaceae bacterium]|nr:cytochrome c biogenesis protein CcsA [Gaiellaceae bacterium]